MKLQVSFAEYSLFYRALSYEVITWNHVPQQQFADDRWQYEVATIRRLLKIIGLFCRRALYKKIYAAKEAL